ncbi:MAG: hypothetical protein MPL62_10270 [Alphaproteobacteria bacterium]|nr:hypothetical protein [Alphaproteobacteria bacterium]
MKRTAPTLKGGPEDGPEDRLDGGLSDTAGFAVLRGAGDVSVRRGFGGAIVFCWG